MIFETDDPAGPSFAVDWFKAVVVGAACSLSAIIVGGFGFVIYKLLF